jgi:hypothetical protein
MPTQQDSLYDQLTKSPSLIDTFDTDDWSEVGVPDIYVNTSTEKLVVKFDRTSTNNKCVYDLGRAVSDNYWVLRYHKVNFSVVGASNALGYSGISSGGTGTARSDSQDFIGLIWNDNGTVGKYGTVYADGAAIPTLNNTGSYQTTYTPSTSTDYWVEIKRDNGTMTITWFTDSSFSTQAWSISQSVPATVGELRYLTFNNYNSSTSDTPIEFTVDKVTLTSVTGQRFVENFTDGVSLNTFRWGIGYQDDSTGNTWNMADEIDGGIKLQCGTAATNQAIYMSFMSGTSNGTVTTIPIKPFSHNGSVMIAVWKLNSITSAVWSGGGFAQDGRGDVAGANMAYVYGGTGNAKFTLRTSNNGGSQTDTASTVNDDTDWHTHKIECKSSTVDYVIDGLTAVTSSTNLPTAKMAPIFNSHKSGSSMQIRYVECYNT